MNSGPGMIEFDCSPSASHGFPSSRDFSEPASHKDIEVAEYLIDRKLYLSALEYYFEQLERGKKIHVLQNFFTDLTLSDVPISTFGEETQSSIGSCFSVYLSVFHHCAHLAHYQSVSTLDSVDIGRASDDGNGLEDKLKGMEYSLFVIHIVSIGI